VPRVNKILVYPKRSGRNAPPAEVPADLARDFSEASAVIADSPQASAALSRRCLQQILVEHAGAQGRDLAQQIQSVLDRPGLPSYLAEALDAVRTIGNFAAHPIKSTHSREIIPVEANEAEWSLDILESLFDFYFVQPVKLEQRRSALTEKLQSAGKPALKRGVHDA